MNIKDLYQQDLGVRKVANMVRLYDTGRIGYGSWARLDDYQVDRARPKEIWLVHDYLGGSDYVHRYVMEANIAVMKDLLSEADVPEDSWLIVHGGHGTKQLILRGDIEDEEIVDTIKNLYDYPIIDESMLGQVEHEAKVEYVDDYFRYDLSKSLVQHLEDDVLDVDALEDYIEDFLEENEDDVKAVLYEFAEVDNDGSTIYIRDEDAAEAVARRLLPKRAIRDL